VLEVEHETLYRYRGSVELAQHIAFLRPRDDATQRLLDHRLQIEPPPSQLRSDLDAFGNVPWPLMQASFHLVRPTANLAKAVGLVDRAWDDEFLASLMTA